jgi:DNA-binding CsgD family transcriptional regulator
VRAIGEKPLSSPIDPRDREMADHLPVVIVAAEPRSLDAATATAELAGLTVVDDWALDEEPWDLSRRPVVVRGPVGETTTENATVVDVVVRGAGAIIGVHPEPRRDARLLDALRRAAPLHDWRGCPLMSLDREQIELLYALASGRSTRAAARELNMSERTAHRRVADARGVLNATSTNAAAAEVVTAVRSWH